MTNKLDQLNHDSVNDLLEYVEAAYSCGSGVHELRDAFEQYLVLSDDSKGTKLSRKELFDSLMVALMYFENAHFNPTQISWDPTNPN